MEEQNDTETGPDTPRESEVADTRADDSPATWADIKAIAAGVNRALKDVHGRMDRSEADCTLLKEGIRGQRGDINAGGASTQVAKADAARANQGLIRLKAEVQELAQRVFKLERPSS